ncbi:MAG: dihydrodipicolinate synthase family protein [Spirochaetaceae bacterium]|jgi:4-hydroxy-tetrahydrodipicolinate synthase|nr:dihydrodipicolinate synthase family protein [Spirochaetaceae bacterium]
MDAEYIAPALTIFNAEGNIDIRGNKVLYDYLIQNGINGIAVMGSSGEFFSMSMDQRKALAELALTCIAGRVKTLIGAGCMTPRDTIALAKYALDRGANGVLIVGPYYINLDRAAILRYYDSVVDHIDGAVYLYNYPDRTGYDLDSEMTRTLLERHPNIAGYKDTCVAMAHTREILRATTLGGFPDFRVYCGYDDNFAHNVLSGGAGAIGALSNLVPDICARWVKALQNNDLAVAADMQRYINRMMEFYALGVPFMPIMKAALIQKGLTLPPCCLEPLEEPGEEQQERLSRLMAEMFSPSM